MKATVISKLVTNKTASQSPKLQSISFNISGPIIRNETMEGREYIVAPMVMIVEGVLAGSDGPLYYPASELEKTPMVWNQKPVVVYHPTMNGEGVSACDPEIISEYKVGVIMNTKFEDGRLTAEAWLEQSRIDEVDKRIGEALETNEMMELSTGLFVENVEEEGTFNGDAYTARATNLRPDHLALLPDKTGACSIAAGAGFIRNALSTTVEIDDSVVKNVERRAIARAKEELEPYIQISVNEVSHDNTRSQLYNLVREKFKDRADSDGWVSVWIESVYDSFFVYELDNKLWQLEYSLSGDIASIQGDPVEVIRVTEFRTVGGAFVGNSTITNKSMNKKEKVDALIVNDQTNFGEDDREFLMKQDETMLDKLVPVANAAPEKKVEEEAPEAEVSTNEGTDDKEETAEEYLSKAPAEVQSVLRNGLNSYNAEKAKLIQVITANALNTFTAEKLQGKEVDELKDIAALAKQVTAPAPATNQGFNYGGQGGAAPVAPIVANDDHTEEPLEMASMGYDD